MEVRALLILKQLKVRVIVIDEVHNLLAGSPREQRVILQLFRHFEQRAEGVAGLPWPRRGSRGDSRRYSAFEMARSNGVAAVEGR